MKLLTATFCSSFVTCVIVTPFVKRLARRYGIIDHPDEHRKCHRVATPLGGGVAVMIAFLAVVTAVLVASDSQRAVVADNGPFLAALAASAILLCGIGLFDDRYGLRGRQKLLGQIAAVAILLPAGILIRQVQVFDWTLELGPLAVPFTMFWLLGAINALNLIDGVDGLATSVGIVMSLAAAAMAAMTNHYTEAFLALAMAGALCGFLVYNSPPASIFLGDAGSMLIGLVLGALAIRSALKGPTTVILAAPTAIWAIPIFDVSMAILRRGLTGRSIYTTDRGHLHHSLKQRGYSDTRIVLTVGVLCCVTAIGAGLSVYLRNELTAVAAAIAACSVLVLTRLFGHRECRLLLQRMKGLARSLVPSLSKKQTQPAHIQTVFEDNRHWQELWSALTAYAERLHLNAVQLNVSQPATNHEFHASWHRKVVPGDLPTWQFDAPIHVGDRTVGRLRIVGTSDRGSAFSWVSELIEGLKPVEMYVADLLEGNGNGSPIVLGASDNVAADEEVTSIRVTT